MSEAWSIETGAIHIGDKDDDGNAVPHLAFVVMFGNEEVCLGLDRDLHRITFLVNAANERMQQRGFFMPDGAAT